MNKKIFIISLSLILFLIITILLINILNRNDKSIDSSSKIIETNEITNNTNIASKLILKDSKTEIKNNDENITNTIKKAISSYISNKNINNNLAISFYDFNSKSYYGFNDETYFTAASVYKLPLALYYYDEIDENKLNLNDIITIYANISENHNVESDKDITDEENNKTKDQNSNHTYKNVYNSSREKHSALLSELLTQSIRYSNNEASHILFENLGGWLEYKKNITKYHSVVDTDDKYYSYDNVVTSKFLSDVLNIIYTNKEKYKLLIEDMKLSNPTEYLNGKSSMNNIYYQKYGEYGNSVNSAGFTDDDNPYTLVVLTDIGDGGIVLSDIGKLVYETVNNYYNK